jgi:hypothetical protein
LARIEFVLPFQQQVHIGSFPKTAARAATKVIGQRVDNVIHGDTITGVEWTLIQMPTFSSRWRAEKLADEDLQALELAIMRDPSAQGVMRATGGLRKIRFAPPSRGKGKSGSMRVGYAQFPDFELILLVTLFLKKDEDNLDDATRNGIKSVLSRISEILKSGGRP